MRRGRVPRGRVVQKERGMVVVRVCDVNRARASGMGLLGGEGFSDGRWGGHAMLARDGGGPCEGRGYRGGKVQRWENLQVWVRGGSRAGAHRSSDARAGPGALGRGSGTERKSPALVRDVWRWDREGAGRRDTARKKLTSWDSELTALGDGEVHFVDSDIDFALDDVKAHEPAPRVDGRFEASCGEVDQTTIEELFTDDATVCIVSRGARVHVDRVATVGDDYCEGQFSVAQ